MEEKEDWGQTLLQVAMPSTYHVLPCIDLGKYYAFFSLCIPIGFVLEGEEGRRTSLPSPLCFPVYAIPHPWKEGDLTTYILSVDFTLSQDIVITCRSCITVEKEGKGDVGCGLCFLGTTHTTVEKEQTQR